MKTIYKSIKLFAVAVFAMTILVSIRPNAVASTDAKSGVTASSSAVSFGGGDGQETHGHPK